MKNPPTPLLILSPYENLSPSQQRYYTRSQHLVFQILNYTNASTIGADTRPTTFIFYASVTLILFYKMLFSYGYEAFL